MDERGEEIPIEMKPLPGNVPYPAPFQFRITPRSDKHVDLIRKLEKDNLWEESDAHLLELEV